MTRHTIAVVALAASAIFGHAAPGHATDPIQAQVRDNFLAADANRDAVLAPREFVTFVNLNADYGIGRSRMIRRFGAYETAFERLDTNLDGLVAPEELAAAASQNF